MRDYLLYFFPSSCFEPGEEDSQPNPAYAIRICNSSKALPVTTAAKPVNLHCSWEAFDFMKQKGLRAKKGVS